MKLVVSADLHLRPESANTVFAVLDLLVGIALRNGCEGIALLGDIWHVRYAVPVDTLNAFHAWIGRVAEANLKLILLAGNHDQIDVSGQNALQVFDGMANVTVISKPCSFIGCVWLPYDRDVVRMGANAVRLQQDSGNKIAFLHQGLVGARMNNDVVAAEGDGIAPQALAGFELAFLGHWHRHQTIGNATYCGSPWQTRADEAGQTKGVLLVDTDARRWQFTELQLGQRHFRIDGGSDVRFVLSALKPGDMVRVGADVSDEAVSALRDRARTVGVEIFQDASRGEFKPRLGIGADAPLRAHAVRFLEQQEADPEKRAKLLGVFDEMMARAGQ